MSGHFHALGALPLGREGLLPLSRKLVGPQSWSAHFGEQNPLLLLPAVQPMALSLY